MADLERTVVQAADEGNHLPAQRGEVRAEVALVEEVPVLQVVEDYGRDDGAVVLQAEGVVDSGERPRLVDP